MRQETRRPAELYHLPKFPRKARKGILCQRKQVPHPAAFFQLPRVCLLIILHAALQPPLRIGVADRRLVDLQDQGFQARVALSDGIGLHKFRKPGLLLRILCPVMILQKLPDHVALQKLQLALVPDPKGGIQVDLVEIIADHVLAEAVDGGDLGVVDQRLLPLQMLVFRIGQKPLLQGQAHPLPHLRRSGLREGHYQQAVHIHRLLSLQIAADDRQDPLHQHRRLAGAGRCGHQHVFIPDINHPSLFFRPGYAHFFPSSCIWGFAASKFSGVSASIRCQISGSFRACSLRTWKPFVLASRPQTPR